MSAVDEALKLAKVEGKPMKLHVGPIHSRVSGRTDHLPVHVESGSYVLPAHHVSGLGESNTTAGFDVIKRMFGEIERQYGGLPYHGKGDIPYSGGEGPYGSHIPRADGGAADAGQPVPCVLAGGEFVLSPRQVAAAGNGDMDAGHRALDDWVKRETQNLAKTIKNLPPPRKD